MVLLAGTAKSGANRGRASWSEEDLRAAMEAFKSGRMTKSAAVRRYGIPRGTLNDHLKTGSIVKRFGRKLVFSEKQEKELVRRIHNLTTKGMPLTSKLIRKEAFDFCLEFNIEHTFNRTAGLAGEDWYRGFVKRHPETNPVLRRKRNKK